LIRRAPVFCKFSLIEPRAGFNFSISNHLMDCYFALTGSAIGTREISCSDLQRYCTAPSDFLPVIPRRLGVEKQYGSTAPVRDCRE